MLSAVTLLALLASAQGRAVNISNTWVLPEEGFPVFYRYFRDRISWYEADAVCQFHHANLVTVDTTAQYDAVRAYLKELDISSAVWVGLIRSNPDGDFTWTDYRGLSGEGYWSSAPDARTAPLCAAANPAADYRWEARACGGPTVASFICELPVPQWALGNEGCMVRELPALTILYLPESAAVQLTADCGMAGVKRVQCTGNVKREDLLKELSCNDEEELSSTSSTSITGVTWPIISTDITVTDQDVTSDMTTEESIVPERNETEKQFNISQSTPIPNTLYTALDLIQPIKVPSFKNINNVLFEKHIDLNVINKNNMQSNDIPKIAVDSNYLTEEQLDKIEDEKNKHHKMIHEEFAKHGNFENIFTQPTDHFVPPLVMAKAKLSDDMTVLSIEEKHAQQLAEHKQVLFNSQHNKYMTMNKTSTDKSKLEIVTDAPNIPPATIAILKEKGKKVIIKNTVPKKYNDPKNKVLKSVEVENNKIGKFVELSTQSSSTTKEFETSTSDTVNQDGKQDESDDTIDLKVIIKDDPIDQHTAKPVFPNYSGDITKLEVMSNDSVNSHEIAIDHTSSSPITTAETAEIIQNNAMIHEIINITIITENKSTVSPIVYEISTKMPVFETNFSKIPTLTTPQPSESKLNFTTEFINLPSSMNTGASDIKNITSTTPLQTISTVVPPTSTNVNADNGTNYTIFAIDKATTEFPASATTMQNLTQDSIQKHNESIPVNANSSTENVLYNENIDLELEHNSTDSIIDDFQSPLLSAASEPLHRPNRSRRPQQPNRTKFNPFRILG